MQCGRGGRLGVSVCQFAGRADRPLRLKLGKRLLVLLVAPIDVAALIDSSRWPEQLVQARLEQCVFAALLFGDRTMWRGGWGCPSWARPAPAPVLADGH